MTVLPSSVATLTKLKRLDISFNPMRMFPLPTLPPSLQLISATDAGLQQLPDSGWASLPQLLEFDVSRNRLKELPTSLSDCKKLRILRASDNQLVEVPAAILQGTVVDNVSFKGNKFDVKQFEKMEGFAEYMGRRKARLDKSLSNSVNLEGLNDVM